MHSLMPVLAEASANIQYKLARLQTLTEWWHWLVLLVAVRWPIVAFVVWMYRKDSVELPRGLADLALPAAAGGLCSAFCSSSSAWRSGPSGSW